MHPDNDANVFDLSSHPFKDDDEYDDTTVFSSTNRIVSNNLLLATDNFIVGDFILIALFVYFVAVSWLSELGLIGTAEHVPFSVF